MHDISDYELQAAAAALSNILESTPNLSFHGFGVTRESSEKLSQCEAREFILARRWLRQFPQLKRVSKLNSSYGLKHRAEKAMGAYISNGVLIAAAIGEGIKVQRVAPDSPNAWLALQVSGSSIRAMQRLLAMSAP